MPWHTATIFQLYAQELLKGENRVIPETTWYTRLCHDTRSFYRYHSRILSAICCGAMGVYFMLVYIFVVIIPLWDGHANAIADLWAEEGI